MTAVGQLLTRKLSRHKRFARHSLILAFEGSDAAGKGGAIRRVTGALDARQYVTVPVAAPTEEEARQPYLWRFWRQLPERGRRGSAPVSDDTRRSLSGPATSISLASLLAIASAKELKSWTTIRKALDPPITFWR